MKREKLFLLLVQLIISSRRYWVQFEMISSQNACRVRFGPHHKLQLWTLKMKKEFVDLHSSSESV